MAYEYQGEWQEDEEWYEDWQEEDDWDDEWQEDDDYEVWPEEEQYEVWQAEDHSSESAPQALKNVCVTPWMWPSWLAPKAMVATVDYHVWEDIESWDAPFKGKGKKGDMLLPNGAPVPMDGFWMVELLANEGAVEQKSFRPIICTAKVYCRYNEPCLEESCCYDIWIFYVFRNTLIQILL